jgi:hypothetical protein
MEDMILISRSEYENADSDIGTDIVGSGIARGNIIVEKRPQ